MIKLLSMLLTLLNNVKLELNVPPLLLTKLESNNSNLNKCGKVQMVPSEIFLMEQSSENQLLSIIFLDLFQDGKNQSLSEDMLLVINIEPQILLLIDQELFKSFSEIHKENKKKCKSINLKVKEVLD